MKRRRVTNQDTNKASDGVTSLPNPPVAPSNQMSDSPCMLNTVFEVLLPLEPKIAQNQTFDCSTLLNNDNTVTNKMFTKNQFNLCKKCGGLEEYCECVASGDFENINAYTENITSKKEEKADNKPKRDIIVEKEHKISEEEFTDRSVLQKDKESVSKSSYVVTELITTTDSIEPGTDIQIQNNIGFSVDECKDLITSETSQDLKSDDIGFCYEEIIESNQSENDFDSTSQSFSELNNPSKTQKPMLEMRDSCDTFNTKDHELAPPQRFEDLASSSTALDSQPQLPSMDLEDQGKEINTIKEVSWEKLMDGKSSTTFQSTSHLSSTQQSTSVVSTYQSEDSDNHGEDNMQIFEQMDLDDVHLEIPSKVDASLLEELKEAEKKSKRTAHLINQIKDSIKQFQSKENLTEEDALVIKIKQVELAKKLAEFEEIARRVQNLVGIEEVNEIETELSVNEEIEEQEPIPKDKTELEHEKGQCLQDVTKQEETVAEAVEETPPNDSEIEEKETTLHGMEEIKEEEIELIQTHCNLLQQTHNDKMSYLGKDSEVTNFLMMDKIIPKVIVCGSQDSMPRVIVCEKPSVPTPPTVPYSSPPPFFPDFGHPFSNKGNSLFDKQADVPDMMISLSGRLSESYLLQEKLASENAALEDGRYILQEELLKRDNIVDALQKKVGCLQTEMRIVAKENLALQEKLEEYNSMDPCSCAPAKKPSKQGRMSPGGFNNNNASNLERQLNMIEGEVRTMQSELQQVQKERQQLEHQRKLLKCSSTTPICMPGSRGSGMGAGMAPSMPKTCVCGPIGGARGGEGPELQLRELREQYVRLEDDFKNKVAEVSTLRREVEKWKCKCESAKEAQEAAEEECRCIQSQLKAAEQDKKKMLGSREQMMEQEQQLNIAKQRFREAQDELDELRALIQDQTTQLEDYRNKYLQAQQQVEEQRRQIDVMEMENSRISDQVNLEIQRVKAQFQEKLQELTPLPDILKATQMKLQECQQARLLSERNCEELAVELQTAKDQLAEVQRTLEMNRDGMEGPKIDALQEKVQELKEENGRLRSELIRLDEIAAQAQRRLEEKSHDAAQLAAQLDTVREESARQVARTKDRAETMRRSLQCQISEMERQLAQSRAAARSAQKDRDEIRQRMQCQINNLNESFEQAQLRIRSLQSHVNFLKSSYSNIFEPNCPNLNPAITECACATGGQDYNF